MCIMIRCAPLSEMHEKCIRNVIEWWSELKVIPFQARVGNEPSMFVEHSSELTTSERSVIFDYKSCLERAEQWTLLVSMSRAEYFCAHARGAS